MPKQKKVAEPTPPELSAQQMLALRYVALGWPNELIKERTGWELSQVGSVVVELAVALGRSSRRACALDYVSYYVEQDCIGGLEPGERLAEMKGVANARMAMLTTSPDLQPRHFEAGRLLGNLEHINLPLSALAKLMSPPKEQAYFVRMANEVGRALQPRSAADCNWPIRLGSIFYLADPAA